MNALRLFVLLAGLIGFVSSAAARPGDCASLKSLRLPHVEILIANSVSGALTEDFVVERAPRTYQVPRTFCRVRGISRPVAGSEIGFELWLPVAGWSGRLHMIGNGGYVSNISYEQMASRLEDGDVAVGTDTGHSGTNLKFGWKQPQRISDFGHRAVHESVIAAKAVTRAFYGRLPRWSYFSGCSTGGYQGLSEAQRYPDDFDGIIAGAPGNNRTNLTLAFLWNYLANHRPGDDAHPILSVPDLVMINRAAVAACDPLDGVKDGVISDPRDCRFDIASLACRAGQKVSCLSEEQIAAARRIYAGPKDRRDGRSIYPPYPIGSEGVQVSAEDKRAGWSSYWSSTANPAEPSRADLFRYWVFDDPNWNWWNFDWGKDVDRVRRTLSPVFDAVDPNLAPFARRGGKLIMFIGWQDPVGTAYEAINYHDSVLRLQPGASEGQRRAATQRFLRLFMVPGMGHCAGGPGATNLSTATRDSTPPVRDASHDMTLALQQWVEQGHAPQQLIATRYSEGTDALPPAQRPIAFQRPVCAWPSRPVYRGGPVEAATSFTCETAP